MTILYWALALVCIAALAVAGWCVGWWIVLVGSYRQEDYDDLG